MADAVRIREHITRLSAKKGYDPLAVVGLLAIHALADVDFARLRFWRTVSETMAQTA